MKTHKLTERAEKSHSPVKRLGTSRRGGHLGVLFLRWRRVVEVPPRLAMSILLQCTQVAFLEVWWPVLLRKWFQTLLLG